MVHSLVHCTLIHGRWVLPLLIELSLPHWLLWLLHAKATHLSLVVESTRVPGGHHLIVLCLLLGLAVELWLEATAFLLLLLLLLL